MARRKQSGLDLTRSLPWPLCLALGFLVIAGFVAPDSATSAATPALNSGATATIDWAALAFGGLGSFLVFVASRGRKHALAAQPGVDGLRALSGTEFASLIREACRQEGYAVETVADEDGAGLTLRKAGRVELVQCRHWRTREIDAAQVRDLWDQTLGRGADAAKIIATGNFTPMAAAFAAGKPIELINGARLLAMIRAVRRTTRS